MNTFKFYLLRFLLVTAFFISVFSDVQLNAQNILNQLPVFQSSNSLYKKDWLVTPVNEKATVLRSADNKNIILYNGLLKRTFRINPNVACIDFTNLTSGEQLLRAIQPEASVMINGTGYNIGGLYGQKENAYLIPQQADSFVSNAHDFIFGHFTVSDIQPYINWKPITWAINKNQPSGKTLSFVYTCAQAALRNIIVTVHYNLYDGLPLLCKWFTIENKGDSILKIAKTVNEILAAAEEESAVVGSTGAMKKPHGIYVESNYSFNNSMRADISDQTTHWMADTAYTSQVNYNFQTPCLLKVYPNIGPGVVLKHGETFTSIRTFELLLDSYDRERNGLAKKRMYSTIAPWTTENPIFMHLVSKNDDEVKTAIDQCAATGYEAVILSFGSNCDIEDTSAENIKRWKALAAYAHKKGIMIGGYSLFSSRRISDKDDVIDSVTGKPDAGAFFGHAPCLGSEWGLTYINKLEYFFAQTGFNIFENDGPYPGDVCASTRHPGHAGLDDSQWKQMELQKGLYHWCNEHSIYINAPDWYFLDGTNKIALGYREVNFSLPRQQQIILNRQNIYDGLWEKTGSMSWGFVPLTKYQGGDSEAVLEPLSEHLKDYEQLMMQYYGAGVQACYRGPRLYDNDNTKAVVIKTINWYKKYRDILNSDLIHIRRADGRDYDAIMHVNYQLKEKGLVMIFNPLNEPITRTIKLPLYYTGLTSVAKISEKDGAFKTYKLNRDYSINVIVKIPASSYTWLVVE